jgi:NAD(P)-dependent dehydrogenase (short-subunit alcohol dehydrogenase family)
VEGLDLIAVGDRDEARRVELPAFTICVSPGPVATDLWLGKDGVAATVATASGVDADTARKNVIASIGGMPTGRFTTPEEVATLVVMLASPRLGNVTGSNYIIDGGLIKTT